MDGMQTLDVPDRQVGDDSDVARGAASGQHAARARSANPLRRRDFQLLWIGEAISSLGDQFALIALPWLSLVLTGSSLALGGVLALMAFPRAVLMLFGGVAVDRLSPRLVMFASNAVRLITVAALAGLVLADAMTMPALYAFALIFGVADAFFWPAQQAILPALVEADELGPANAVVQGTAQITVFLGPVLAGVVIAALGASGTGPSFAGIGVALLVDAVSFVASLVTLALIRGGSQRPADPEPVLAALRAGLAAVWQWPSLRFVVLLVTAMNLLVVGPLDVGLPVLAYTRLPGGAAAFGLIMSALGAGSLVGMIVAGIGPRPPASRFGPFVLSIAAVIGLGLAGLALVPSTPAACLVALVAGAAMGYVNLTFITWAQQRIPKAVMGRVFSVILLGSVGLVPLSQVVAGALVQLSLDGTMIVSGVAMALLTLAAATRPAVRAMGLEPILADGPGA
jgi:MFS family permease